MKLVGGDSGRYEHETLVEEVLLAPSERAIVDVLFDTTRLVLPSSTGPRITPMSSRAVVVSDAVVEQSFVTEFEELRTDAELTAERARVSTADRERVPDKTLAFELLICRSFHGYLDATAAAWTCPMHPEVMSHGTGHPAPPAA